jgi:nicotinate-nucleotide pyrophosphorylase (carboxylating)
VGAALAEDMPWGDVTSETLVPAATTAFGRFVVKQDGVVAGLGVVATVFAELEPSVELTPCTEDGERVCTGQAVAEIRGPARPILIGERTALNLLQRMSGIATATARYVAAIDGTSATIIDTRKTAPGLRVLDKYAVRCGGGSNHRFSLSDGVLVKDNHIAALGGVDALPEVLRRARAAVPHTTRIEVEVDRLDQIEPALRGGADIILLDNMSPVQLRQAVDLIAGRALTEASGGITLDAVRAIAESGVDLISVGALTHSVRALDIGLDIQLAVEA